MAPAHTLMENGFVHGRYVTQFFLRLQLLLKLIQAAVPRSILQLFPTFILRSVPSGARNGLLVP